MKYIHLVISFMLFSNFASSQNRIYLLNNNITHSYSYTKHFKSDTLFLNIQLQLSSNMESEVFYPLIFDSYRMLNDSVIILKSAYVKPFISDTSISKFSIELYRNTGFYGNHKFDSLFVIPNNKKLTILKEVIYLNSKVKSKRIEFSIYDEIVDSIDKKENTIYYIPLKSVMYNFRLPYFCEMDGSEYFGE